MKRLLLFTIIIFSSTYMLSAQKSKIIGVFQLIESGKYVESKGIIEEAKTKKSTSKWSRTYYAKGILCQTAYSEGVKKNDKKLYELYPDQLYEAYRSFNRARYLDKRGRLNKKLPPRYVLLANDFMKLGEKHFKAKEFEESFRAFNKALQINKSTLFTIKLDTSLLYNAAITAYKSKNLDFAIKYLTELNKYNYSSDVPNLLFSVYMKQSDTISAQKVLIDGIKNYEDKEELILLLVDLFFKQDAPEKAINILNDAFRKDTSNYKYPYTIGLLHQKTEEYNKAIEAYELALTLPSDTLNIYTSIGTCYYNMGVEKAEKARTISNNSEYLEAKEKSVAAFNLALIWYEKAYKLDNKNQEIHSKLNQLYIILNQKEKLKNLQSYF